MGAKHGVERRIRRSRAERNAPLISAELAVARLRRRYRSRPEPEHDENGHPPLRRRGQDESHGDVDVDCGVSAVVDVTVQAPCTRSGVRRDCPCLDRSHAT